MQKHVIDNFATLADNLKAIIIQNYGLGNKKTDQILQFELMIAN